MKKEKVDLFWPIITTFLGTIIIGLIYGIIHTIAFPHGRYVRWLGGGAGDSIGLHGIVIFIVLCMGIPCLLATRTEFRKVALYANAIARQDIATAITKASKVYGSAHGVGTMYYLTFELPGRERKTFEVELMQYNIVIEGETGFLTYKQNGEHLYFLEFKPI